MADKTPKRRYRAAPIVEAVLELRFSAPAADARLRKAADRLRNRYGSLEVDQLNQAQIDFVAQAVSFTDEGKLHKLSSSDLTHQCHISRNAVAWVERAPYEGWDVFMGRVEVEWPIVSKALGSLAISRIGLRFVNRIDVEVKDDGLFYHEEFLNFKISTDPLLEPTYGYNWQLTKRFPDIGLGATVQSGVVEPEIPGTSAFTFDIDVFCDSNVPQSVDGVFSKLADMRTLKNRIFETGITDKARDQYS